MNKILHNRAILILGISESVSGIGNWITMMAIFALIVFRGDGTVLQSSSIFLAGLLPILLFSPLAGRLADRFDRKRLLMASEFLSGLAVVGLIFARQIELIYILIALEATFGSLMMPARQAAIVDLVERQDLTRANAFLGQLAGIIKIGAPMLAGLVLALVGPHSAMILDVISFGLSVIILSQLPALPPPAKSAKPARLDATGKGTAATGARPASTLSALRDSPHLTLLFAMAFSVTFVIMGFDVLSSVFTRDVLKGNEEFFGLLIGLVGLGTVIVTTGLVLLKGEQRPWRDALAGLVLLAGIPGFLWLATLSQDTMLTQVLAVIGCLVGGLGNGLVSVQAGTLLQLSSPPELLGRLSGIFQSTFVAGQLMAIFVTPLLISSFLPMGTYFGIAALALLSITLGATFILRNTRASMPAQSATLAE